jgi:hypothetical protein
MLFLALFILSACTGKVASPHTKTFVEPAGAELNGLKGRGEDGFVSADILLVDQGGASVKLIASIRNITTVQVIEVHYACDSLVRLTGLRATPQCPEWAMHPLRPGESVKVELDLGRSRLPPTDEPRVATVVYGISDIADASRTLTVPLSH